MMDLGGGQPRYGAVQHDNPVLLQLIENSLKFWQPEPRIAEIGCDVGNASLAILKLLNNKGYLSIFDFEDKVEAVRLKAKEAGFRNLETYGCTRAYMDSYNWSLAPLLQLNRPVFHCVYLDGAHTWAVDGFTFFLVDRLLVPGGVLVLDDWDWSIATSPTLCMDDTMRAMYPAHQRETNQVKMIIDLLVKPAGYTEHVPNMVYQKGTNNGQEGKAGIRETVRSDREEG